MVAYPGLVAVAGVKVRHADYPEDPAMFICAAPRVLAITSREATKRSATSTTSSSTDEDLGSTLSW